MNSVNATSTQQTSPTLDVYGVLSCGFCYAVLTFIDHKNQSLRLLKQCWTSRAWFCSKDEVEIGVRPCGEGLGVAVVWEWILTLMRDKGINECRRVCVPLWMYNVHSYTQCKEHHPHSGSSLFFGIICCIWKWSRGPIQVKNRAAMAKLTYFSRPFKRCANGTRADEQHSRTKKPQKSSQWKNTNTGWGRQMIFWNTNFNQCIGCQSHTKREHSSKCEPIFELAT